MRAATASRRSTSAAAATRRGAGRTSTCRSELLRDRPEIDVRLIVLDHERASLDADRAVAIVADDLDGAEPDAFGAACVVVHAELVRECGGLVDAEHLRAVTIGDVLEH